MGVPRQLHRRLVVLLQRMLTGCVGFNDPPNWNKRMDAEKNTKFLLTLNMNPSGDPQRHHLETIQVCIVMPCFARDYTVCVHSLITRSAPLRDGTC